MAELIDQTGSCLCGSVTFTAKKVDSDVGVCHCEMCRKWGGGPFISVDCHSEVEFEGLQHIRCFDSSQWAERGFCQNCGTHLFYRLKGKQQHFMLVGLFDSDQEMVLDHQIFIDEKPDFYEFANETKNMTGAEAFAQFSS